MRAALLVLIVATTSVAHAQTPTRPTVIRGERTETYVGGLILADLAAAGLLAAGGSLDSAPLLLGGTVVYLGGAPFVHVTKGEGGHAAASLALRVGLPIVGGLVGAGIRIDRGCDEENDPLCEDQFERLWPHGIVVGMIAAAALDYALLSRRVVREPTRMWTPAVSRTDGGLALGVVGRF